MSRKQQEVISIRRDIGADEDLRPILFTENLDVLRYIGAHRVIVDATANIVRKFRIVETALVGFERHSDTALRKTIRNVLSSIDIHNRNAHLVFSTLPDPVCEQLSIRRDILNLNRNRIVRAHRIWIEQYLVLSVQPIPYVNDRLVLVGD